MQLTGSGSAHFGRVPRRSMIATPSNGAKLMPRRRSRGSYPHGASGSHTPPGPVMKCPKCQRENPGNAKFSRAMRGYIGRD